MLNENKVYIIAEAGVNHNGSIDLAIQLVKAAAVAGADAVKFQTFQTESLVTFDAPKAGYQERSTAPQESQFAMLKKLELDAHAHKELKEFCKEEKIDFLSTPFDIPSANFLSNELNIEKIKISSGDLTNAPLLFHIALTQKPIILSTGMATLPEVKDALGVLALGYLKRCDDKPSHDTIMQAYLSEQGQALLKEKVSLLHCTTEYPAPYSEVNLRGMDALKDAFGLPVGLSDHTLGIAVALAAVARGATIVEKHFTLKNSLPGPDHKASLEPSELQLMVKSIRQLEVALGNGAKTPTESEMKNRSIVRKSLVASRAICRGELFTEQNLTCKRPGNGVSPMFFWEWLGRKAERDYAKDEII